MIEAGSKAENDPGQEPHDACWNSRGSFLFRHAPTFGSPDYILNSRLDTGLAFADELFGLTPANFLCYGYSYVRSIRTPNARLTEARIRATASIAKTIFDGTKLPLVVEHLKTTTYGMKT